MRQRPAWKCIGAETLMDHSQGGGDPGISKIRKIGFHLFRRQHAFVDQRSRRQAVEVQLGRRLFDTFANEVKLSFEIVNGPEVWIAANENLLEDGLHSLGGIPNRFVVRRYVAPSEDSLSGARDRGFDDFFAPALGVRITRQENRPDAIVARRGQLNAQLLTLCFQKVVWNLD